MTTFINLLTLSRIFLAAIIFLLLTSSNGYLMALVLFFIAGIGLYIVPGFDVVRYEWSQPLPLSIRIIAILVYLPCFVFLG